MSLVTVLKCIFCGGQPGRAGALRPPLRSSSAPFAACSAAAATEIREAILKAFALGDRGLFSSIGETPMQEQQQRQPPTTSPPSHPLTLLLSTAPSREVRVRPPSFHTGWREAKKKPLNQKTTQTLCPPRPGKGVGEQETSLGPFAASAEHGSGRIEPCQRQGTRGGDKYRTPRIYFPGSQFLPPQLRSLRLINLFFIFPSPQPRPPASAPPPPPSPPFLLHVGKVAPL